MGSLDGKNWRPKISPCSPFNNHLPANRTGEIITDDIAALILLVKKPKGKKPHASLPLTWPFHSPSWLFSFFPWRTTIPWIPSFTLSPFHSFPWLLHSHWTGALHPQEPSIHSKPSFTLFHTDPFPSRFDPIYSQNPFPSSLHPSNSRPVPHQMTGLPAIQKTLPFTLNNLPFIT